MKTKALLLSLALILPLLGARKPQPQFTGTITKFDDGDTCWVEKSPTDKVKLRLWLADAPEISHKGGDPDQPGARDALDFVNKQYLGHQITVTVKGHSYDRIVAQVVEDKTKESIGLSLVSRGYAQIDPRYHPSQEYKKAQMTAKEGHLGIWSQPSDPIPPWEWRATHKKIQP